MTDSKSTFSAIIGTEPLEQTLEAVGTVVGECKLSLDSDGMQIRAVHPANVCMCDVRLDQSAFEAYDLAAANDSLTLGVNLDKLQDVINVSSKEQLIHIELDNETRKLIITVDSLEYTLALIDPDSIRSEPDIPDLDHNATITTGPENLTRALTAADMVSDHIALGVNTEAEHFYAEADGDTDTVDIEVGRDDLIELDIGEAHSLFSLDYLSDIKKAFSATDQIVIRLDEEFPVMIDYQFANQAGSVLFMLAPRIQSD